jgi:hypothetical protein
LTKNEKRNVKFKKVNKLLKKMIDLKNKFDNLDFNFLEMEKIL